MFWTMLIPLISRPIPAGMLPRTCCLQVEKLEDEARLLEKKSAELEVAEQQELDKLLSEHAKVEAELHSYNQRILAAISVE